MAMAIRAGLVTLLALMLAACGGGGGGGGGQTPLSITFQPAALSVTGVERNPVTANAIAKIQYTPGVLLYLGVEERGGLIADVRGEPSGDNAIALVLTFNDLPAGSHGSELLLHACLDETCTREAGPPGRLPLGLRVLPNLHGPATISLQRSGREAAPESLSTLDIPAAAGAIDITVDSADPYRFDVSLSGSQLRVRTRQEPAGRYTGTVRLGSRNDSRYQLSIPIDYTVLAPPGGEQPMSVSTPLIEVSLAQGEVQTRRFTLTRATWTDVLDPPSFVGAGVMQLTAMGNDEYEVTFDARNVAPGSWSGGVNFTAGPTGNSVGVSLWAHVGAAFELTEPLQRVIDASSTAADLRLSTPVRATDGSAVRWTATSQADWLRLLTPTGLTGVDTLQVEIDAAALPRLSFSNAAEVVVSIDRPGTLPVTAVAGLNLSIPRLDRASRAVLAGTRGRLYVQGSIPQIFGDLTTNARLRVDGARLLQASTPSDPRFAGMAAVLQADVADAVPGTDITVRIDSALMPTQAVIRVEPPVKVPVGYLALPYDAYRPPSHAPGRRAVYFAGRDRVHAWRHDATGWTLASAAVPGLIDVTPEPDEARLIASSGADALIALEPSTLTELGRSSLLPVSSAEATFEPAAPQGTRALAFAADLRAFASKAGLGLWPGYHGIGWVGPPAGGVDLLGGPGWLDPGLSLWQTGPAGLIRSADGQTLAYEFGVGRGWKVYQAAGRAPRDLQGVEHPAPLAAISDDGQTLLWADGLVRLAMGTVLDLKPLLPATHEAAGFALGPTGNVAVIYGYRPDVEGGVPRARDARLWILALSDVAPGTRVLGDVVLPDAVGCTSATPAPGEACAHRALITLSADGGSAFVLGPRGIAAVPLPDSVTAFSAPRARAASLLRMLPAGSPRPATPR